MAHVRRVCVSDSETIIMKCASVEREELRLLVRIISEPESDLYHVHYSIWSSASISKAVTERSSHLAMRNPATAKALTCVDLNTKEGVA